jgi:hypothetical protein
MRIEKRLAKRNETKNQKNQKTKQKKMLRKEQVSGERNNSDGAVSALCIWRHVQFICPLNPGSFLSAAMPP